MLVEFVDDKRAPELLAPSTGVWMECERLDCCAVTPLVEEAAKVDTEVVVLLEAVRPGEAELGLAGL